MMVRAHPVPTSPDTGIDREERGHGSLLGQRDIRKYKGYCAGSLAQRVQRLVRHDFSIPYDRNPIAKPFHFAQRVTRKEHGVSLGDTLPEHIREYVLHQRVETAGRFVEDQQSRLMREGQYQTQLLLHAAVDLGTRDRFPGEIVPPTRVPWRTIQRRESVPESTPGFPSSTSTTANHRGDNRVRG